MNKGHLASTVRRQYTWKSIYCGCWENPKGHNRENLTRRKNRLNIHKGMTSPLIQNLKTVGLWVFFLIYCLTFSFLFNVRLRPTLGFLTVLLVEVRCCVWRLQTIGTYIQSLKIKKKAYKQAQLTEAADTHED